MPAWILTVLGSVGGIAASLGMQLVTETFAKRAIVAAMRALVRKTESELDDELVEDVAAAWNLPPKA